MHRTVQGSIRNKLFFAASSVSAWYKTIRALAQSTRTMVYVFGGHIPEQQLRLPESIERQWGISELPFVGLAAHEPPQQKADDLTDEWPFQVWLPNLTWRQTSKAGPLGASERGGLPALQKRTCLFQGEQVADAGTKLTVLQLTSKAWGDEGRGGRITHITIKNQGLAGVGQQFDVVHDEPLCAIDTDCVNDPQAVPEALRAKEVLVERRGRTYVQTTQTMQHVPGGKVGASDSEPDDATKTGD